MSPEEAQKLEASLQEIASILYNNTAPEDIKSLEGIEKTVREQMLEHISPKIALFLSEKSQGQTKADNDR